jgi:hypothetical protein
MRYARKFNKITVNSVVLFFMILFSSHTIIQKAMAKRKKCSQSLKKENQQMKRTFQPLQSITLIFGQAHQLTSSWTERYKALVLLQFEYETSSAIC